MKGHGEKLTRKQEALMSALLLAPTLADAAHTAGIGEVTAWRWLKDPTVQHAIAQVQRATGEAVATLRNVMQDADASASARMSAAKAILETAIKAVEVEDLEARIAALEAQGQPQ